MLLLKKLVFPGARVPSFTEFLERGPGFVCVLDRVLPSFTEFYRVLPSFWNAIEGDVRRIRIEEIGGEKKRKKNGKKAKTKTKRKRNETTKEFGTPMEN